MPVKIPIAERIASWVYATSDIQLLKSMLTASDKVVAGVKPLEDDPVAEPYFKPAIGVMASAADGNVNARTMLDWIESLSKPLELSGRSKDRQEEMKASRAVEIHSLRRLRATLADRLGS